MFKIGQFLALLAPRRVGYRIAVLAADIKRVLSPRDRQHMYDNLSVVLGDQSPAVIKKYVKQAFRNFAKYLTDFFRYPLMDTKFLDDNVTVVNKHFVDTAAENHKGVILVSAHFGNWELGAVLIPYLGYAFNAVVLNNRNRFVNDFFVRQRERMGINVILVGDALKDSVRALRNKEILALVADWDFTGHVTEVNFFGKKTGIPRGPAVLSMMTGAPIVPGFVIRQKDDTFSLVFEKPIIPDAKLKQSARIRELVQGYASAIESYITKHPDQWYAFRPYWPQQN